MDKTSFLWYFLPIINDCIYMSILETYRPLLLKKSFQAGVALAIVVVIGLLYFTGGTEEVIEVKSSDTQVKLTTANEYLGGESVSLIGNVRAFSEAAITSERSGRVVRVNVSLGQTVSAGQVLATLENASESAAVLQAEGVYDAAVAASTQSGIGVDEAQSNLKTTKDSVVVTLQSAFNTVNATVSSDIDVFFNQPLSPAPRLLIAGKGYTRTLELQKVQIEDTIETWRQSTVNLNSNSDLDAAIQISKENITELLTMVDTFLIIFKEDENASRLEKFTAVKTSLLNTQSSLSAAQSQLVAANDLIRKAEASASGSTSSAADAQIKQALGSLRAAQANYAKTVLRTPISGTLNEVTVKAGDYVNTSQKIAEVANNNALEIVTFVGDTEVQLLAVGDVVYIENKYEGVIAQIAPSVDATTRKTEVRIATENTEIKNGDTVTITKEVLETDNTNTIIPLTAVKFEIEDGFIFTVVDNKLVKNPVKLGVVRGSSVEIIEGLDSNQTFVKDARGLVDGDVVTVSE
jgi:RND family efflux transporter MFP subunit